MTLNEYEQFAKAFRCSVPMAESIVQRIRQRVGRDVPMGEILGAIKKIAPTRLTTDTIVMRLQKTGSTRPVRAASQEDDDDLMEPEEDGTEEEPSSLRVRKATASARRPAGVQGQINEILDRNWAKAKDSGLKPPEMTTERFVRTAQSAVGEPKPTVARVLEAVRKLSKQDVLITPNLVADEIIETDELR